MASRDTVFVWLDLEMSGLNPLVDKILEIAVVLTDAQLEVIAEGPDLVIYQPPEVLQGMDAWNQNQHKHSGLINLVKESKLNEKTAENKILEFLSQHVAAGKSPLCGNSVHNDRFFLYNYMPKLEAYLHYRNLDVSSIKILAQAWYPQIYNGVKKKTNHRAKDDILESIMELKYYREHFIKLP